MNKLQFLRNYRQVSWVAPDCLWVTDGAGTIHLVSADEAYSVQEDDFPQLSHYFYEVSRPPDLHTDDLPIELH